MVRLVRRLRSERGGVLATVAIALPALVITASFVIDVGTWFVHKRHLQLQADAGALATGSLFNGCFTNTAGTNAAIRNEARRFAGDPGLGGSMNRQIGGGRSGGVLVNINDQQFPVGGPGPDDTVEAEPCPAQMTDVKLSNTDVPWFFRAARVRTINAHARVAIQQAGTGKGMLPWAVNDSAPETAAAIFVNEVTGAVIAKDELENTGSQTLNSRTLEQWDNLASAASVTLPVGASRVPTRTGVVIALSGRDALDLSFTTLTEICGQPLTQCYAGTSGTSGLLRIHGYSSADAPTGGVTLMGVDLEGASCSPSESAPYLVLSGSCTGLLANVRARIKWGNSFTAPAGAAVQIPGGVAGCPSTGNPALRNCPMMPDPAYNGEAGWWVTHTRKPVWTAGTGAANVVSLQYRTSAAGAFQTIPNVHRSYGFDASAGSIEFAQVSSLNTGDLYANSLPYDDGAHTLQVKIGVAKSLRLHVPGDPPVLLRVASPSGSQNQAVDCDVGANLEAEIRDGCQTLYGLNTGQPCPNTASPPNCVPLETGDRLGQFRSGIEDRFVGSGGSKCTPNNWPDYGTTGIPPGDPRAVPLFVTPFGSFQSSGNELVPIIKFATFYVTGWDDNIDDCPGNEDHPQGLSHSGDNGDAWGHFIKYIFATGGTGNETPCDPTDLGSCVATMTR